jgi:hypothetical protein
LGFLHWVRDTKKHQNQSLEGKFHVQKWYNLLHFMYKPYLCNWNNNDRIPVCNYEAHILDIITIIIITMKGATHHKIFSRLVFF